MIEVSRTRVSVTLTQPYIDGLDQLIERGLYLDRGTAITQAIKNFFEEHGVEPFAKKEPPKEG